MYLRCINISSHHQSPWNSRVLRWAFGDRGSRAESWWKTTPSNFHNIACPPQQGRGDIKGASTSRRPKPKGHVRAQLRCPWVTQYHNNCSTDGTYMSRLGPVSLQIIVAESSYSRAVHGTWNLTTIIPCVNPAWSIRKWDWTNNPVDREKMTNKPRGCTSVRKVTTSRHHPNGPGRGFVILEMLRWGRHYQYAFKNAWISHPTQTVIMEQSVRHSVVPGAAGGTVCVSKLRLWVGSCLPMGLKTLSRGGWKMGFGGGFFTPKKWFLF